MPAKIDRGSLDELFSLTYEELRRLANCVLQGERAAQITPTTLVNETWIKLAGSPEIAATSALHFRRIAGRPCGRCWWTRRGGGWRRSMGAG